MPPMLGEWSWDHNVGRRVTVSSTCLQNLMCVRVLLYLHMDIYIYIYTKSENLCYLFLHMYVHSFYAYVKINKINKITQLDAIHVFFVQMMKNHIPMKWGLSLYRFRPTYKTRWINVNLYNTRIFALKWIFFLLTVLKLFWIRDILLTKRVSF